MCVAALGAASSIMSAAVGLGQAKAAASAYNEQAKLARRNALAAEAQAKNAAYSGAEEEQAVRRKGRRVMGAQAAGYGANNIDISSGSALDVLNSTNYDNLMDALAVRRNAANEVYGYQTEAVNSRNQAKSYQTAAANATKAGWLNAGASLLSGTTSLAGRYRKYRSSGDSGWEW